MGCGASTVAAGHLDELPKEPPREKEEPKWQPSPNGRQNGQSLKAAKAHQDEGEQRAGKHEKSFEFNSNQKTLDERIRDGEIGTRTRRGGVSSEQVHSANAASARAAFESRLNQAGDVTKDKQTRAMLQNAIEQSILFSGMNEQQKEMIIDVMVSVRTLRNEVVIREGEMLTGAASDNFYIVGEGSFQIHRSRASGPSMLTLQQTDASSGARPPPPASSTPAVQLLEGEVDVGVGGSGSSPDQELVQTRRPGDAFGELALLYDMPRQASVTCSSEYAVLWALQRSVYREICQLEALDSIQSIIETLQSVQLLSCLAEDQFNRLIDSFEMVNYFPQDRIIRQGELGNAFYIILKGTVNCIAAEQVVATMNRCDYFGERALLKDEPRAVHVDAVTNVTLAKITRDTFIDILGSLQSLMENQFTRRVLTRVPILSHLSEAERMQVLDKFVEQSFEADTPIVTQGEVGDLFYIVKEGQVDCFKDGKKVRTYTSGEYFGERALRLHEPRAATCTARGPVTCVTLNKHDFETLLGPLQSVLDHNMLKDTLRTAPLFRYLTSAERESVLDGFEFCEFSEGEMIFREGDPGMSFVMIREGAVKLIRGDELVGEKKGGDHLGEKSLLYGTVREYNAVVSSSKCLAAFLDQGKFEAVMGPIADVLKRASEVVKRTDLEEHTLIGVGTFGKVRLVRDRQSQRIFAMKIISKAKVLQYNQQEHIISEKTILAECDHPFIIQLMATFKDPERLYMVLEYCAGGELFSLLQRHKRLKEEHCVFYAGSVMLAFEYLHEMSVIYRDLKPENLLLDSKGYVKICDFGFAKRIKDRTWTLCGTPEYLAPEIIRSKGHGKGVDWWALGILIYEMAAGFPPYCGDSAMQTYKLILEGALEFPRSVGHYAKDLVRRLLHPSVTKRLGCLRNGSADVRLHRWFADLNIQHLLRMKLPTPYVPRVRDPLDTSNFPHYEEAPDAPYVDDNSGWDDAF